MGNNPSSQQGGGQDQQHPTGLRSFSLAAFAAARNQKQHPASSEHTASSSVTNTTANHATGRAGTIPPHAANQQRRKAPKLKAGTTTTATTTTANAVTSLKTTIPCGIGRLQSEVQGTPRPIPVSKGVQVDDRNQREESVRDGQPFEAELREGDGNSYQSRKRGSVGAAMLDEDSDLSNGASDYASESGEEYEYQISDNRTYPTLITWTQGGQRVYITGTFNQWERKLPLVKSTRDFTTVMELPIGVHQFKFIVDDEWKCAAELPSIIDAEGNMVNFIEVKEPKPIEDMDGSTLLETSQGFRAASPPGKYTREFPKFLRALMEDDPQLMALPKVAHAVPDGAETQKMTMETHGELDKYIQSPPAQPLPISKPARAQNDYSNHTPGQLFPSGMSASYSMLSQISSSPHSQGMARVIPPSMLQAGVASSPQGSDMGQLSARPAAVAETSAANLTRMAASPASGTDPYTSQASSLQSPLAASPPSTHASQVLRPARLHPALALEPSTVFTDTKGVGMAHRRNTFAGVSLRTQQQDNSVVVMLQSLDHSPVDSTEGAVSESSVSSIEDEDDNEDLEPPGLPLHLTRVILNQPQTQSQNHHHRSHHRTSSHHRGRPPSSSLSPASAGPSSRNSQDLLMPHPSLPYPYRVSLNHLYACSIKNGTMAVAVTSRYRRKFVTTILYKPVVF